MNAELLSGWFCCLRLGLCQLQSAGPRGRLAQSELDEQERDLTGILEEFRRNSEYEGSTAENTGDDWAVTVFKRASGNRDIIRHVPITKMKFSKREACANHEL
jgi:hypothetical protein